MHETSGPARSVAGCVAGGAYGTKSRSVESHPVRRWVEGAYLDLRLQGMKKTCTCHQEAVLFYARGVLRPLCRWACAVLTSTTRRTMPFHTAINKRKPDTHHVNLCLLITFEIATRHYRTRPVMAPRILHCRTHPPLPPRLPHDQPPCLHHPPAAERRGSLWRAHL